MAESESKEIMIDWTSIWVFWKFVEFCYLGEISKDPTFTPQEILELLELACEYCMLDLR